MIFESEKITIFIYPNCNNAEACLSFYPIRSFVLRGVKSELRFSAVMTLLKILSFTEVPI